MSSLNRTKETRLYKVSDTRAIMALLFIFLAQQLANILTVTSTKIHLYHLNITVQDLVLCIKAQVHEVLDKFCMLLYPNHLWWGLLRNHLVRSYVCLLCLPVRHSQDI